jgi:hypothetical protein
MTEDAQSTGQLPKLFCIILATPKSFKGSSALNVLNTWVHKCDNYHFISKLPASLQTNPTDDKNNYKYQNKSFFGNEIGAPWNIMHPEGYFENDEYRKLAWKVLYAFRSIYMKYRSTYDWFLKADTDTFVHVNNLKKFLKDKNPQDPVTYG